MGFGFLLLGFGALPDVLVSTSIFPELLICASPFGLVSTMIGGGIENMNRYKKNQV